MQTFLILDVVVAAAAIIGVIMTCGIALWWKLF